jgi:CRISPR-associated protein Cmr6
MSSANLGKLFYYDYFQDMEITAEGKASYKAGTDPIETRKRRLTNAQLSAFAAEIALAEQATGSANTRFELETTYPGLLLGTGYQHEVGVTAEFILGFFFDHATGLPMIPGSSIKGVLRSAFATPAFVLSLIDETQKYGLSDEEQLKRIKPLELEIFGPSHSEVLARANDSQDVFYDAYPVASKSDKILAEDTLTPHINRKDSKMNAFSEPVPLNFVKVPSEVRFRFAFDCQESKVWPGLNKAALYQKILLVLGLGAKTNVGYGHFVPVQGLTDVGTAAARQSDQKTCFVPAQIQAPSAAWVQSEREPAAAAYWVLKEEQVEVPKPKGPVLEVGAEHMATIVKVQGGDKYELEIEGYYGKKISQRGPKGLGGICRVKITKMDSSGDILNVQFL